MISAIALSDYNDAIMMSDDTPNGIFWFIAKRLQLCPQQTSPMVKKRDQWYLWFIPKRLLFTAITTNGKKCHAHAAKTLQSHCNHYAKKKVNEKIIKNKTCVVVFCQPTSSAELSPHNQRGYSVALSKDRHNLPTKKQTCLISKKFCPPSSDIWGAHFTSELMNRYILF